MESGRWAAESKEFSSARTVSGAAVRATAQLDKSQAAVWSKVSGYNAAVGAASATESLNAAYDKPEVRERMLTQGAVPHALPTEKFDAFVKAEVEKLAKVIKASGARAN